MRVCDEILTIKNYMKMGKLKCLLISLVVLFIASCSEPDVDGGAVYNLYISNGTSHKIEIKSDSTEVLYTISPSEKVEIMYEAEGLPVQPYPFGLNSVIFITFDDTLSYKCTPNKETRCMITDAFFYESIEVKDNVRKLLYEITEEDYEYAKAHPYKYE